ncbi:molybdopterin molybdotransferase MoeA [Pseudoduganella aquatica]|uniref:Molybdenum cofactor guanylyltransferase n=1 Tax=Pseudoduganella aquatica TaxID=2660641 RepID=A0A7X4KNS1_9BURK|nr:gephyrin-like molybdotransferase Glp [Pseudoduganella aquatica]MYN09477.1 molybdenum cofactor guanylyltransferase MobA [Pseudoduganella aquatica]
MSVINITGLILAGGRGTRMGRVDKGLQHFQSSTLAAHVMQRLAPQVASVAISANRNQAAYEAMGVPVWPDELAGFEGPLAGLQTALRRCRTELLLTAPCDSPFLPADLAERLHAALLTQDADLAVAVTMETDESGERYRRVHPVFSLMKASVLPQLSAYLDSGARRMDGWYKSVRVAEVLFDDNAAFRNINTLGDLKDMEALAARAAQPAQHQPGGAGYTPDAMPVEQAQALIRSLVQRHAPVPLAQRVGLRSALDRVLAADIISPIDVPAHDNSAMDGYAFRGADLLPDAPTTFKVVATAYAGRPAAVPAGPGECVRIMTGAVMPPGLDTVLPQELAAAVGDGSVTVAPGSIAPGANRRFRGEDLAAGAPALRKGKRVSPADLGLIASLGIAEVAVQARLRVAYFSTGDELRSIGETLDAGSIYDSNRYTLFGMLERLGCEAIDLGSVKDDPDTLRATLRQACEHADVVLTTGGVSTGAADYIRQIMAELGDVAFWKMEMRPGRPMAFGRIQSGGHSALLFGLPGNPVAAMVAFYFFARGALLQMMGVDAERQALPLMRARSAAAIRKKPGRTEYQRGILAADGQGGQEVRITGAQGSGILRSMSEANCMVVLHASQGDTAPGDLVDVVLFDGLV